MRDIVIGMGKTGKPLYKILKKAYIETISYDSKDRCLPSTTVEVLNICIPYNEGFKGTVKSYQSQFAPALTIIHSTVPIGTTSQIPDAVHSPIRGKHNRMEQDLRNYVKWVGGTKAKEAVDYLTGAGFKCCSVKTSEQTEAMKLLCLAKYGMSIAFSHYCKEIADKYDFDNGYRDVLMWDREYNKFVEEGLKRPIINLTGNIGGHCIILNTKILNEQHHNLILEEILKYA